jgi:hypothetical protein
MAGAVILGACGTREAVMQGQDSASSNASVQAISDVAGFWRITPGSGGAKPSCQIALNALPQSGGQGLHVETCSIPALAGARSWRLAGEGFEILDGRGAVIAAFRRTAVDRFVSTDGAYRMEPQPVA